jgi:hypothetical protein
MKKDFYLFAFILAWSLRLDASHIVGAQLYYDCLGNNTYRITLIEYRNCSANCTFCAPYANPEYIQVFDTSGNYIDSFAAPLPSLDTLVLLGPDSCDYCVEAAAYYTTITLPYLPGGYVLVYQRCCRNAAILNITTNSGATYFTNILDSVELSGCDSRPRFNTLSPQFFPIDTPFTFDMSATDPDGDSLVYRLTNSYDGASSACPDPSPAAAGSACPVAASPPPYISVSYLVPYTPTNPTNNPLDSGHLQIDPHTGLLSGRVNQSGIFLIAVAADEYRNGTLIGSTLLDFQFIFGGCPIDTVPVDTVPANSVNNLENKSIKIYSLGNEAIVDFYGQNNGPLSILFYDLLGRKIAEDDNYTGSIYTKQFINNAPQYIVAKVQLSSGDIIYKKLLVEDK